MGIEKKCIAERAQEIILMLVLKFIFWNILIWLNFEFSPGLIQLEDFYSLNWSLVSFSLGQDDFILKRGAFNIDSISLSSILDVIYMVALTGGISEAGKIKLFLAIYPCVYTSPRTKKGCVYKDLNKI